MAIEHTGATRSSQPAGPEVPVPVPVVVPVVVPLLQMKPNPSRQWLKWLAAIGWAEILLAAAHRFAPGAAVPPLAAYAAGFSAVVASALLCAWRCPPLPPRALALLPLPALGLYLIQAQAVADLDAALIVTACLLFGGTLLGAVVGRRIEHPGHLLFVAIVSAAADVFSVFHPSGPSAAVVESEAALSVLALPWPFLGTGSTEPFLGVGDVVFTALYFACAARHELAKGRTLLALTLGYAVTMVAVVALEVAVPALPFLGLAMVAAHAQARRPPEKDRVRGYVAAAIVVAVVAVLLLH
jgi:hypothetical protein